MSKEEVGEGAKGPRSRRKFMKDVGGSVLLTAAASTVPSISQAAQGTGSGWNSTVDWICVGSGVAGCAAAIAGSDQGMKTLLVEKSNMIGGISSQSGGSLWVPMSHLAKAAGVKDSREEALDYLRYAGGGYSLPEHMETFVDHVARVFEYLQRKADVRLKLSGGAEFYYPVAPGSKQSGRSLVVEPFSSSELGSWRDKVLLPVYYRGFLEGNATEGSEGGAGPTRNSENRLVHWRKRLGAAKVEALLKQNDEERVGGAGLMAYLFRAILKRGIDVQTGANVERLVFQDDRAVGIELNQGGQRKRIQAKKGVLLATGGDALGLDKPEGWKLAVPGGAAVIARATIQAQLFVPVPGEKYPDGKPSGRINYEIGKTHGLIVNRFAERVGDEPFFQALGTTLNRFDYWGEHRFRNIPLYIVFDQGYVEEHGFGGLPRGVTEGLEWVTQGKTLAELAAKMKLPGPALEATVGRFNEQARSGNDPDFKRAAKTLGPVDKPPFYAVKMHTPDPYEAQINVVVDTNAQALNDATRKPIPGLYASGSVMSIMHIWGMGYQAGHSLAGGATYGFLAAEHAARAKA